MHIILAHPCEEYAETESRFESNWNPEMERATLISNTENCYEVNFQEAKGR